MKYLKIRWRELFYGWDRKRDKNIFINTCFLYDLLLIFMFIGMAPDDTIPGLVSNDHNE